MAKNNTFDYSKYLNRIVTKQQTLLNHIRTLKFESIETITHG